MSKKKVGECQRCGVTTYHDNKHPTSEESNVGDYDFVCYPCQFWLMDHHKWEEFKERHMHLQGTKGWA